MSVKLILMFKTLGVFAFIVLFGTTLTSCNLDKSSFSTKSDDRWTYINTSKGDLDGNLYDVFIDNSSITSSSTYGVKTCKAWMKHILKNDSKIDYQLIFIEANCDDKSLTYLRYTTYYKDGTNFSAESREKFLFVPDSIGESISNYLCNK